MSDKRAILFGYYGARNIGDELMLLCLNRWLERQNIRTTVGAISPGDVEHLHATAGVPGPAVARPIRLGGCMDARKGLRTTGADAAS